MDEPGFAGDFPGSEFTSQFPSSFRVGIWGLGLMGGSMAMALHGKCARLTAIDPDPDALNLALERGIVDAAFSPEELKTGTKQLGSVDLLILAAPVRAILQTLADLSSLVQGRVTVIDLGSTKAQIVDAMGALPERFDPIGGHPMCGKEQSSLRYAEADLYRNAPFALVPLERTSANARALAEQLVHFLDACPLWIDAETHDRWVAATSHAPFLLSGALVQATPLESAPLIGPGFRGMARLSSGSTRMMADILTTNRENIRAALGRIRSAVDAWDAALATGDDAALIALLDEANHQYQTLKGNS